MALAKRDEGSKVNSDINVTPMVDVMLVLLIIFMVVTPMLQHGAPVDMVQAENPINMQDADKEDAILIAITKNGGIFLGSNQVKPEELTGLVQDKLTKKTDKRVFLKADARAKYGIVVDVVDDVRTAGVDQLGLITEQKRPNTPQPPNVASEPPSPPPTT